MEGNLVRRQVCQHPCVYLSTCSPPRAQALRGCDSCWTAAGDPPNTHGALQNDVAAKAAACELKRKWHTKTEALMHGDLHTGGVPHPPVFLYREGGGTLCL